MSGPPFKNTPQPGTRAKVTRSNPLSWLTESADGIQIAVRLAPRGARNAIEGVRHDALVVRVTAPAVDGKANRALIRLLAKRLGIAAGRVQLVAGTLSRNKRLAVAGIAMATALTRLTGTTTV